MMPMAAYKVSSDRFDGKKRGDQVADSDLSGLNVDALVIGGHLEPVRTPKTDKISEER
jgi:hypothetical protein